MRRLAPPPPPRHRRLHIHRRPGKVGYFTKAPRRLQRSAALISRRRERLDLVSDGEEKPQDVYPRSSPTPSSYRNIISLEEPGMV